MQPYLPPYHATLPSSLPCNLTFLPTLQPYLPPYPATLPPYCYRTFSLYPPYLIYIPTLLPYVPPHPATLPSSLPFYTNEIHKYLWFKFDIIMNETYLEQYN